MNNPNSRNHKPVIFVDNYDKVDGRNANNTEVQGLSLGLSSWNDSGKPTISAKVWSNTIDNETEHSEVIPIHRILDLSILICSSLVHFSEAYRFEHLYDPQNPVIERIGLQGNTMNVAVCAENEEIQQDIKLFNDALNNDGEMIGERLRTLSRLLKEVGYC